MRDGDIWRLIDAQRADLADFLDGLTPEQWEAPSLCADWTIRDVAAHVTQSTGSWWWFGVQAVRSGFRFDAMMSGLARQDRRPPAEITAAMRAMVGIRRRPPGTTVADPLVDVLVHGQDIARPLGLTRDVPTDAAVVAAERLWNMTFPLHPRKQLSGAELVATDADFRVGSGVTFTGSMADVLLVLAGRATLSTLLARAE